MDRLRYFVITVHPTKHLAGWTVMTSAACN